jgi:RHS repeat-associated protein
MKPTVRTNAMIINCSFSAARSNTSADNQLDVDATHKIAVEVTDSQMRILQQDGGVGWTALDTAAVGTTLNTWYDFHIITEGNRLEVWRGPQGGTTELVLETDALTLLETAKVSLRTTNATASFDNVQFITTDPATQTMAYNGANELTSSVVGAITTTYTYDQHGRTISKADGTHSARYIWFAGDKLKQYESDFPGEGDVAYNYDALGKRRVKLVNLSAPTDADYTWYRWDAGWNMVGEYAAGSDTSTEWDVGALERWYGVGPGSDRGRVLVHADGDPDIFPYNYYFHDHQDTPQVISDGAQMVTGRQQLLPYGGPILNAGLSIYVGYTGHGSDKELNSLYSPYRYYSLQAIRWLNKDPLGPVDGENLYNYVAGNPIWLHDPLGLAGIGNCANAPPSPPSCETCGKYGSADSFLGYDAKCVCEKAGTSPWDNAVRGCLACAHGKAGPNRAHFECYVATCRRIGWMACTRGQVDIYTRLTGDGPGKCGGMFPAAKPHLPLGPAIAMR